MFLMLSNIFYFPFLVFSSPPESLSALVKRHHHFYNETQQFPRRQHQFPVFFCLEFLISTGYILSPPHSSSTKKQKTPRLLPHPTPFHPPIQGKNEQKSSLFRGCSFCLEVPSRATFREAQIRVTSTTGDGDRGMSRRRLSRRVANRIGFGFRLRSDRQR